jgi:hypothetical protein
MSNLIDNLNKIFDLAVQNEDNIDKVLQYLAKYGYIDATKEPSIEELIHIIVSIHGLVGDNTTGVISKETLHIMSLPRCGCKDVLKEIEGATGLDDWGKHQLNYFIGSYPQSVAKTDWFASLRQAFDYGEAVCNIKLTQVNSAQNADILIDAGQGPRDEFDGPSGVLAWCELPPSPNFLGQIQSKFDADENWLSVGKQGNGIRIVNVACHEIVGHGLGLPHTNVPNSLMNPIYNVKIDRPQTWDIQQLVARYGKPLAQPTPTPIPPTNPPPVNPPTPVGGLVIRISKDGVPSIDGFRVSKI